MATAPARAPAGPVEERVAAQVEQMILKRISDDALALPVLPGIAGRCGTAARKGDLSVPETIALIESDPLLAVEVLRLARPPRAAAAAAAEPARSVFDAVNRLGMPRMKQLLGDMSVRQSHQSRDPAIMKAAQATWEHCVAVALLARDLVMLTNSGNADLAYLTGLLHDVGKPIVATMLLEAEKNVLGSRSSATWLSAASWLQVIQKIHRRVGLALAQAWELPEPIPGAIRECAEYDSVDRFSVSNAVRFANTVTKQQGIYPVHVSEADMAALFMIGRSLLGLDEEMVPRVTADLRVRAQQQLGW